VAFAVVFPIVIEEELITELILELPTETKLDPLAATVTEIGFTVVVPEVFANEYDKPVPTELTVVLPITIVVEFAKMLTVELPTLTLPETSGVVYKSVKF